MKNEDVLVRLGVQEDIQQIAAVHIQGWHESYKGIIPKEYLDSLSVLEKAEKRASYTSTMTFVAQVDNTIVGFCDVGRGPFNYEVHQSNFWAKKS